MIRENAETKGSFSSRASMLSYFNDYTPKLILPGNGS